MARALSRKGFIVLPRTSRDDFMDNIDVVVVGAGVVGLAVAASVGRKGLGVYVIERNDSFGRETSSRNSEVIHAGIYYNPGSLKARLCVEGNGMLYDICSKNNIPHRNITKIIVACSRDEELGLDELFKKGRACGARDLRLITKKEIGKLEPAVKASSGLFSPSTGIIDSHALMKFFTYKIKEAGAEIVYNSRLTGIKKTAGGYKITVEEPGGEFFEFKSKVVINSAGLSADCVAQAAGIDVEKEDYRLKYCKGHYFRVNNVSKSSLVNRLVYPVPHHGDAGLGVHVTKDLTGSLRLGPDTLYVDRNKFDYEVDSSLKKSFFESASKFLPFLEDSDLASDTSGIRPKLQGPGEGFRDFIIKEESGLGLPGFINLIGIESPGLTASPAIAEYVAGMVKPFIG